MASKKFKADKKVLAAATLNVLVPRPKLMPESSVERDPSKVVEKWSAGSSTGARLVQAGPEKRKPTEGVAPPAKRAKETLQVQTLPSVQKETVVTKEVGVSKTTARPKSLPVGASGPAPSGSVPPRLPTGYANPQGPQGECAIMMRTFNGWFHEEYGAKGYRIDYFRSFNLPQDLKHFENRSIELVANEYLASHGVTTALSVRLVKMARSASGENAELKKKLEHAEHRDAQKDKLSEAGKKIPFVLVFNLQVPASPNYSLVLYYAADRPVKENLLLGQFVNGTDMFRDSRLKLIPSIKEGYWMVKRAVGTKVCLLGKAVTCKYLREDNFLEIDVDIGSSSVTRSIIGLVLGYVTSIVVDLAILIEGKEERELPEFILGTVRLNRVKLDSAVPLMV